MAAAQGLSDADWEALYRACLLLEHPSLAARLTALLGVPIEQGMKMLPREWHRRLRLTLHGAVERTLEFALSTLPVETSPGGRRLHMTLGAASGAAAGIFGLPALLVELPVATVVMLRGIAAVAQSQGENTAQPETRAECVKVFALGGHPADDDAAETGYYGLRMSLALEFSGAEAGPVLPGGIRLVRAVAQRFGVAVSDKAAAQMVPVLGALSSAAVNALFVRHFYDMAWGHFTVRRLERCYGAEAVAAAYAHAMQRAGGGPGDAAPAPHESGSPAPGRE